MVGLAVLGKWLDCMIVEAFSPLNDSRSPCRYGRPSSHKVIYLLGLEVKVLGMVGVTFFMGKQQSHNKRAPSDQYPLCNGEQELHELWWLG